MSSRMIKEYSFPYPVLGDGENVRGNPVVKVTSLGAEDGAQEGFFVYRIEFCVDNEKIEALIEDGKARCVTEVFCNDTPFRKGFKAQDKSRIVDIKLKSTDVLGRIVFRNVVVAAEDMRYSNDAAAAWYKGKSFNVSIGEPLAILPELQYDTSLQTASKRPLSSWLTIKASSKALVWFDVNGDKVSINLPEVIYRKYAGARVCANRDNETITIAALALPAVMFAIRKFNEHDSSDFAWVRALRAIFEEDDYAAYDLDNISDEEAYEAAQKILVDPMRKLIDQLDSQNVEGQS